MKNRLLIPFISIIALALYGCNSTEVECPGDSIGQLRMGITRNVDTTTTQFIVYCPGLPNTFNDSLISDTIFKGKPVGILQVEIPVDITSEGMAVYFDFIKLETDTTPFEKETDSIKFSYLNHTFMNELECGIVTEFLITGARLDYTTNHIDTAFISNNLINSEKVNHVEIFY